MVKRLFLFAAYDAQGLVDATLVHYLRALSELGDIIVTMDNDVAPDEFKKISKIPHVLHAAAARHGEYDFGSYKRCYQYARDKQILDKYDWVYLVNDSVLGPLSNLAPILENLESRGADFTGLMQYQRAGDTPQHVQSWFMGFSRPVATSQTLADFMDTIGPAANHDAVVLKYEIRLSRVLMRAGCQMATYDAHDTDGVHELYDMPIRVLMRGIPFVKKRSIHIIPSIHQLAPFADSLDILGDIQAYMARYAIKFNTNSYARIFRLTFLSIPLISVWRKRDHGEYKVYLFDKIRVCKIFHQTHN